jgi:hypothetical protein
MWLKHPEDGPTRPKHVGASSVNTCAFCWCLLIAIWKCTVQNTQNVAFFVLFLHTNADGTRTEPVSQGRDEHSSEASVLIMWDSLTSWETVSFWRRTVLRGVSPVCTAVECKCRDVVMSTSQMTFLVQSVQNGVSVESLIGAACAFVTGIDGMWQVERCRGDWEVVVFLKCGYIASQVEVWRGGGGRFRRDFYMVSSLFVVAVCPTKCISSDTAVFRVLSLFLIFRDH